MRFGKGEFHQVKLPLDFEAILFYPILHHTLSALSATSFSCISGGVCSYLAKE